MSVRSVRNEIAKAMRQNPTRHGEKEVSAAEARKIVAEAAKGQVTEGELNALKDVSKRGIDPTGIMTDAIPELHGDSFYLPRDAKVIIDTFVTMHGGNDQPAVTLAIPENRNDTLFR